MVNIGPIKVQFKEAGKGKIGKVRSYSQKFSKDWDEEKKLETFEDIYKTVPLVQAAINYTADLAVGTGYELISEDEGAKKKVDEFLKQQDFTLLMHRVTRHLLVYGNAYLELVRLGEKIVEMKLLHPKTMEVVTSEDNTGEVIGYKQITGPAKTDVVPFDVDEIAHFKWNVIGDSLLGTSAIESVAGVLGIKLEMEKDFRLISHRYAAPQVHYKIGTDSEPATDTQIANFESQLEEHNPEMDLISAHTISADVINPLGSRIGVEEFMKHIENQVIAGLQVPEVALGRGQNITEATAKVQIGIFDRRVKSVQRVLTNQTEALIIRQISEGVRIEFGEFEKEDEDIKVNRLLRLKAGGIVTPEYVAQQLGIDKKFIPEEPEPEVDQVGKPKGNPKDLKGLDDSKTRVSPKKMPVKQMLDDGFYYIKVEDGVISDGSSI